MGRGPKSDGQRTRRPKMGPAPRCANHDSPNRAKVVGPNIYLHKVDLFWVLLVKSCGTQSFTCIKWIYSDFLCPGP